MKNNRSGTQTMRGLYRNRMRTGWLLAAMLAPTIALAALGEDASTVERDVTHLKAQHGVVPAQASSTAYSVHELQLSGGTVVHEYLTTSNQVFAITWKGPSVPELQQLLGTYFPRYSKAAQAIRGTRQPVRVEESDLVIRTGGHPRAFFGMAYLPALMPQGVPVDAIQ